MQNLSWAPPLSHTEYWDHSHSRALVRLQLLPPYSYTLLVGYGDLHLYIVLLVTRRARAVDLIVFLGLKFSLGTIHPRNPLQ